MHSLPEAWWERMGLEVPENNVEGASLTEACCRRRVDSHGEVQSPGTEELIHFTIPLKAEDGGGRMTTRPATLSQTLHPGRDPALGGGMEEGGS